MTIQAGRRAEVRGARVARMVAGQRGDGGAPLPVPAVGEGERPWRFVLVVGSAPNRSPTPFVLNRVTVCALGSGARLLEEPFGPPVRIRLDWPAPTQAEAISAAIAKVESLGLGVLRVDNDDWVTAADIAQRIGRSRETVRLWATNKKGPGGFPPPANPHQETTFYRWSEVLPWLRERADLELTEEEPALAAANLAVQLRALLPRLSSPDAIADLLHRPVPVP